MNWELNLAFKAGRVGEGGEHSEFSKLTKGAYLNRKEMFDTGSTQHTILGYRSMRLQCIKKQ